MRDVPMKTKNIIVQVLLILAGLIMGHRAEAQNTSSPQNMPEPGILSMVSTIQSQTPKQNLQDHILLVMMKAGNPNGF